MKIGELALAAHTQVETIRYYEREALLPQAPRSEGNYRIYGPEHVERLAFVRHCRSLDMTLDEIRVLLRFKDDPQAGCGEVDALLDEHIGHVATRIRELRQLQTQLKALRERCAGVRDAGHCGILDGLVQASSVTGARSSSAHVPGAHGQPGRRGRGPDPVLSRAAGTRAARRP
jgi:Cd(II)/Pb(II)-responsive transcriptional regulator